MTALSVVIKYAETLSIGLSWKFSPQKRLGYMADRNISDLYQKHLLGLYRGGMRLVNIGGRLRSVERSPRFV